MTIENCAGLDKIPYALEVPGQRVRHGRRDGRRCVPGDPKVLGSQGSVAPKRRPTTAILREGSARVAFADITLEVMPDRSIIGRAVYDTVPGTGSILSFELPPDSSLLWATVDFNPAIPLRSVDRDMVDRLRPRSAVPNRIALENRPSLVRLDGLDVARRSPPRGAGPATTLVSVYTPPGLMVRQGDDAGLEARRNGSSGDGSRRLAGPFRRRSGRQVRSQLRTRPREARVAAHQSRDGPARRRAKRSMDRARREPRSEIARVEHDLDLIRSARAARDETMRRAGLEEDLASARIYLGEMPANLTRPTGGVPEPSEPDRIRLLGRPSPLIGVMPGIEATSSKLSLTLEDGRGMRSATPRRPDPSSRSFYSWVSCWSRRLWAVGRGRVRLALVTALGLAGYTGGPLILAGGLGLAAAGWRRARMRPSRSIE